MNNLTEYQRLLARVLVARREQADEGVEDRLLDQMDVVWERLSPQERVLAERISNELASGLLTEDEFIAHILPQQSSSDNDLPIRVNPLAAVPFPRVSEVSSIILPSEATESSSYAVTEVGRTVLDLLRSEAATQVVDELMVGVNLADSTLLSLQGHASQSDHILAFA